MRAKKHIHDSLSRIIASMGFTWPAKTLIEMPKEKSFGDMAVNIALLLAKEAGMPPRLLAEKIADAIKNSDGDIAGAEVAGPGFINITFAPAFWQRIIPVVEAQGASFGSSTPDTPKKVQIEYVSANPTGPLHIGHGRGAAVGDALARVLRFAGRHVETEYYINDAGRQMRLLGLSVWLRLLELAGEPVVQPEDWYRGEYIVDIARELLTQTPDLPTFPEELGIDRCLEYAMGRIFDGIRQDLADFRAHHDIWFSERALVASGAVEQTFSRLREAGCTFEQENALWFRTTSLGDDRDRVLKKSDGSLTYFASDIAYHNDKYNRGFDQVVDIWGADHHGYIPRMRAALAALGKAPECFNVLLIQFVNLLKNGEQVTMSTRAGQFETLADVVREVGADAARYMFLSRKSDSPLDFDLELVKQRTMDNPVYYVQYAHARIAAVLRKASERGIVLAPLSDAALLARLTESTEMDLLRLIDHFADVTVSAANNLAPHHISNYLRELAGALHHYYAACQVLGAKDEHFMRARLALMRATGQTLRIGLGLLGVTAPESM